ncbi:ribosome biogenesis GTPase Der [Marinilongibacter aquaticus]|uniref:ribosome biogenesis GTPase Der n=1 Tax=Marinilongibacter aquaticus TaxID=2975157 RepID=UPI0021BDC488|nr:ribosome biogenesis GTPase Der [Marinilongibacter aquaticus]UBM57880.1 ribosome biogenesis GTPase Der [Marinilongibacter aquaticus]
MANIVAIVGRPNVGKSTLFNRLIEQRMAITDNVAGVTRDRHYGQSVWTEKYFTVIDTGGYVVGSEDTFEGAIRDQVALALDEASVVLFVVDTMTGLTDLDKEFANVLRRVDKPVLIVANKAETFERQSLVAPEFYALGYDQVFPISSMDGSGTGDLLDEVVKHFEDEGIEDPDAGIPKIAILGRPNAGKSSFLNALIGKDRSIVTDIAGTTRDSIHTHYKLFGKDFILTDTAGIRKKAKVKEDIEFYSVLRSLKALESADVCVILLDAEKGLESQDIHIIAHAHNAKKGIVLMVNKWDLIEKDSKTADRMEKEILERLAPMNYMPLIFASALNKQRIFQVIEKAMEVYEGRQQKIPTSKINEVMLPIIEKTPPPALKGKYIKIKYIMQLPTPSPTFIFFCNLPQYIKEPYERFLKNKLRDAFGFDGVAITVLFRKK